MGKRPETLLEVCVARAGGRWRDMPRGTRVAQFVTEWVVAIASGELDHYSVETVAPWWGTPVRTYYRRLAEFRELFPEYETPESIARKIAAEVGATREPMALLKAPLAA